jgi:hypothetical protein
MLSEVCISTSKKERMGEASNTICTTAHLHMQREQTQGKETIINSFN